MIADLKKSLVLRIALPVIVLVFAMGLMLDRFVLNEVSDYIKTEVERDLGSISRRISNICNINFENLLMAGEADNDESLIIKQALTLGQVEDFLTQENLKGLIYDNKINEIILETDLPSKADEWVVKEREFFGLRFTQLKNDGWFAFHENFLPWSWQIIILKNETDYASLETQVNKANFNTLLILVFASVLLIFFIHQTIKKPVNTIIHPLKKKQQPNYQGIDVFEFLSNSISGMMDSLKQSEEKYRSVVETATGFVWELDHKGNYTFVSETIKDILGYDSKEVLGKSPFFTMDDKERDRMITLLSEKTSNSLPFENIVNENKHKNGEIVFLESAGVPVFDKDNKQIGYRGINRDVTRQLRADEELKELERHRQQIHKLEAIGTLAAGLAHDFNNLLSVIMGNISLAKVEIKKDIHIVRLLSQAEKASAKAGELAKQLIVFSEGGMPIKKVGSIRDLIISTINSCVKNSNIKPLVNIQDDLYRVEYDEIQMKQVFENIFTNAVESMPDGGLIIINAQNFKSGKNTNEILPLLSADTYIKIAISDQGKGIDNKNLEKIFDPYYSTKEMGTKKGSGLGLTTAYSIISRHSGRIFVSSEPGSGTTISIFLPAFEKEMEKSKPYEDIKLPKAKVKTGKILLMDDEKMIRTLANHMLKRLGYEPEMAKDGNEAIERYKKALSEWQPFDLVILDLTVKDGMGGKECMKSLLKIDPGIKAIVSSGYSTDPVITEYGRYGFKMALPKPYNKNEMEIAINEILQNKE